jgi:3-oxoacyl-[acyl-carrier protein] reductase
MDFGLKDSVAVVFAASRGLGKATAFALAQEGCKLAICSRNRNAIEKTADEIRDRTGVKVISSVVDVMVPEDITRFADQVKMELSEKVDILVNNGGGPIPGAFDDLTDGDFAKAAELLILNAVRATKAFLPMIRKTGTGGRIINITSSAVREPVANLILSNSLRAAVSGWSKTLARELASEGILVNCVAPGTIQTERIDELISARAKATKEAAQDVEKAMKSRMPMGRFGLPDEFGAVVAFLASKKASYISGSTLYVDGAALASVI